MTSQENINRPFSPAELVRLHEANCSLEFPSADEQNFRLALMKHLARRLGLSELRSTSINGPCSGVERPKASK